MLDRWWVAALWETSPILLVSWVIWVVWSIVLHELAHGWTAIRCGDRTPIETGHMTANPFVHIPQMAWLMFAVTGITWGLMPVDPSRFKGRFDGAKVSLAGPSMNLLLAALCLPALAAWQLATRGHWGPRLTIEDPLAENVAIFLRVGLAMNIFGALFNLLPVPPLDGSRIAANFFPRFERWLADRPAAGLVAFLVLFYTGSDYIFRFAFGAADLATRYTIRLMAPGGFGP
jgi:Zn-dependent protease